MAFLSILHCMKIVFIEAETPCSKLHRKIPSNIVVAVRTSQFTVCISERDVPRKMQPTARILFPLRASFMFRLSH
jgi:hypothetical protein